MNQCYMCTNAGTTIEHVPPKCIFPKPKDLPKGENQRKNLITVRACPDHNTNKTTDDEYLLYVIHLSITSNQTAAEHVATKLTRAIERNPTLIKRLARNQRPVTAVDQETGQVHETLALELEMDRVDRVIDMVARGIYFHHFKKRWLGSVSVNTEFAFHADDVQRNQWLARATELANRAFKTAQHYGENPEVFSYQVASGDDSRIHKVFRFHFYGNTKFTVFLNASE